MTCLCVCAPAPATTSVQAVPLKEPSVPLPGRLTAAISVPSSGDESSALIAASMTSGLETAYGINVRLGSRLASDTRIEVSIVGDDDDSSDNDIIVTPVTELLTLIASASEKFARSK